MKIFQRFQQLGLVLAGACLYLALPPQAFGLTEEVEAIFRPDPTNPLSNKFQNTRRQSGMCISHVPNNLCEKNNIFSLRIPYSITSTGPIEANHADERKGVMFKVPSSWRPVTVINTDNGESHQLEFRIAAIGGSWAVPRPPGVSAWGGSHTGEPRWDEQWKTAPQPCQSTRAHASGASFALFFWIVPENAGTCSRQPGTRLEWLSLGILEYGYELRTPNPLKMTSGNYTGTMTYSMGPNRDLDFGDLLVPNDGELTFNFSLTVDHILNVDIPPGGRSIELQPQGGWQAWLSQGRIPSRLFKDQTFNLYASSPFKMQMECQYPMGNTCGITDSVSGHSVPIQVGVSLPYGLVDAAGRPVSRLPLRLDGAGTELFTPYMYVDRKPGTLHFEVLRENMEEMLRPGESRTYSGAVTVIWDSQV